MFTCRFCAHANPEGARFCNECGSQIDLKPCPQCDAVNGANASACHQCGAVFAERWEPLLAAASSNAMSLGNTAVDLEHASIPEWFAQSKDAIPKPERAVVRSSEVHSDDAFVGTAKPNAGAATLPAVVKLAVAFIRPADRSRDFDQRPKRRSAQGAALLALAFAIAGGAYWAHRPTAVPEDRRAQRGVHGFVQSGQAGVANLPSSTSDAQQPAVSTATKPSVEPAVVQFQSALAVQSPSLDDAFEPKTTHVTAEEPAALPVAAETPSQPPDARTVKRTARATVTSGTRKSITSRAYDAPAPLWAAPASSPADRPCTQAVAALGLCDLPGGR